jgi:drug/metabolite transporter (DMT)-like permease
MSRRKLFKAAAAGMAILAYGTVGALDYGNMSLTQGVIQLVVFLSLFFAFARFAVERVMDKRDSK